MGVASSGAPARISPLTLRLSPPPLEARFWAECGTPAYASTDRWALPLSCLNLLACWSSLSFVTPSPAARLALRAWITLMAAAALAAHALLMLAPAAYQGARLPIAVAQRASRSMCILACFGLSSAPSWELMLAARGAYGVPALLQVLAINATTLTMQALSCSVAVCWAAPLQAATCCFACVLSGSLARYIRSDAALASTAAAACGALARGRRAALLPFGPMVVWAPGSLACGAGAGELLIAFFYAFACFASVYALYERELRLKLGFLRHACIPTMPLPVPLAAPAVRRAALAAAAIALASFTAAEAASLTGGLWWPGPAAA
ncbi:MAG: hypothetical protein J3K34DRAFT_521492 [Monoraphidium minutum]|nr:MAG: hypothetical protein J3K34DRAFT_521492 [Monoraphidium minutum]